MDYKQTPEGYVGLSLATSLNGAAPGQALSGAKVGSKKASQWLKNPLDG